MPVLTTPTKKRPSSAKLARVEAPQELLARLDDRAHRAIGNHRTQRRLRIPSPESPRRPSLRGRYNPRAVPRLRNLTVLALLGGACAGGCRPGQERPNVLLITIDTLRADRPGLLTATPADLARAGRFAAGAVVFEDAEASALVGRCRRSRSVMTGEVRPRTAAGTSARCSTARSTTLPERLLAAGYDTACVASHLFATSRHGCSRASCTATTRTLIPRSTRRRASRRR
jgi:hypothetical protein